MTVAVTVNQLFAAAPEISRVVQLYRRLGEAIEASRTSDMQPLIAKDFRSVKVTGSTVSRGQWFSDLEAQLAAQEYHHVHFAVEKLRAVADQVVVDLVARYTVDRLGGNSGVFHSTTRVRDLLKREGDGLVVLERDTIGREVLLNGAPLTAEQLATSREMCQACGDP
jgi:hypothetical protein